LKYLLKFPGMVASYRRAIRELRPDLVHVDSLLNLPPLVAAKLCGVRTLLHVQEVAYGTVRGALATVAGTLADRVVAVSQAATEPLRRRVNENKLAVVPNGIRLPPSAFPYQPDGWVTFVGRLSEDKDPVSFLRAAERVHAQEPSRKFRIIGLSVPGRERYEARLLRVLRQSRIPEANLSLLRDLEDVEALLREASVVVNSSVIAESFGLAALEAMALGVPVVAPRFGAFPEFVRHEETGLLYAAGDVAEMAESILRLLRDPPFAEQIGRAARDLVRSRFTAKQMATAMAEQYRLLLGHPGASMEHQ